MTTFTSKCAAGQKPVPSLNDGLPGVLLYEYLTTAALVNADIIDLGPFPANVAPLDVAVICQDLDVHATPTITFSVGFLNAGKTDLEGTAFIVDSTVGQAGGIARATTSTLFAAGSSTTERRLGIKVTAAVATSSGAGEKIAVLVTAQG